MCGSTFYFWVCWDIQFSFINHIFVRCNFLPFSSWQQVEGTIYFFNEEKGVLIGVNTECEYKIKNK